MKTPLGIRINGGGDHAIVISGVDPNSVCARMGLSAGDMIVECSGVTFEVRERGGRVGGFADAGELAAVSRQVSIA